MSREQIVRDTAYAIWEAEGKPEGRDREHWTQAEAHVAASVKDGQAKQTKSDAAKGKAKAKGAEPKDANATAPAKGKATAAKEAAPRPPAKPAATKAASGKATGKK